MEDAHTHAHATIVQHAKIEVLHQKLVALNAKEKQLLQEAARLAAEAEAQARIWADLQRLAKENACRPFKTALMWYFKTC